jgi:hypothetical protein
VDAAPGAAFRYRNAPLRKMTEEELAAAVEPGRVYDYDLLDAEEQAAPSGTPPPRR